MVVPIKSVRPKCRIGANGNAVRDAARRRPSWRCRRSMRQRWPGPARLNMERSMSEQTTIAERIDRLKQAVRDWLIISRCGEWRLRYQVEWVDPRDIIKAHKSNLNAK